MPLAVEDHIKKKKKKNKMKMNRNDSKIEPQHASSQPENFSKFEGNEVHEGEECLVSKRNKKSKTKKVASTDRHTDLSKFEGNELYEGEESLVSKRNKKSKTKEVASTDCHTEWLLDYHRKRPGVDVLMRDIDDFMEGYEARLEKERQEKEAAASGEGWTVVVHQKGRRKNVDAESGITVGSVAEASAKANSAKKKSKELDLAFYRFQRREARRNEILELQKRFDDDKKRIAQMRAARKFRPY